MGKEAEFLGREMYTRVDDNNRVWFKVTRMKAYDYQR